MADRILPGDLVAFRATEPDCTATIIDDARLKPPAPGMFNTQDEAVKLQKLWRVRQVIMSRAVYLVLCASEARAMVFHPQGMLLVAETKFLINLKETQHESLRRRT